MTVIIIAYTNYRAPNLHTHLQSPVILCQRSTNGFVACVVPWRRNIAPRRRNRPTEPSQLAVPPHLSVSRVSQSAICKTQIGQGTLEHQDITHKNVLVDHGGYSKPTWKHAKTWVGSDASKTVMKERPPIVRLCPSKCRNKLPVNSILPAHYEHISGSCLDSKSRFTTLSEAQHEHDAWFIQ